jgi:hypothetical protein
MLCEDCNATTLHFTLFGLFGSLVGEGAISVSVCSFFFEKVSALHVCELSIEITKKNHMFITDK